MITLIQGASKLLTSTLTDDSKVVIDPSDTDINNITLELSPETSRKVLAKYSVQALAGYGDITIDVINKTIKVYVDGAETITFPPGKISGKFSVIYDNALYESDLQTLIAQGIIFNIVV